MIVIGNILLTITMLCLISVAGLKWAVGGWMPVLNVMLVVAALSFAGAIFTNAKHYWALIQSDAVGYLAKSLGLTLLVFSFLIAINYLGVQNNHVFDFTENKINSLTEFSEKIVKSLEEEVVFYFFRTDSKQASKEEAYVRNSLDIYHRLNPKVQLKIVSTYQEPLLAAKFNIGDEPSALYATFGERRRRVQVITETELTSAILQLTRPEKKLYFTQSHGERSIVSEESYGLGILKSELERLFYKVEPLSSLPIPDDASFVAIVGPRLAFAEDELQALRNYVAAGGSLLVALDPGQSQNAPELIKHFGVEFQNSFVSLAGTERSPLAVFVSATQNDHDLLRTLQGDQRPLLFLASPLTVIKTSSEAQKVTPLLRYPADSVSRQQISEDAQVTGQGSQIAATITETTGPGDHFSRVVVMGDSDLLTNQFIGQQANFSFIFNAINYLSREKDILNLQPKRAKANFLLMNQTQLNFYVLFFILPFPFLYFIVALFVKLRRVF